MVSIDKRFGAIAETLKEQADILGRIAIYDVRVSLLERHFESLLSAKALVDAAEK